MTDSFLSWSCQIQNNEYQTIQWKTQSYKSLWKHNQGGKSETSYFRTPLVLPSYSLVLPCTPLVLPSYFSRTPFVLPSYFHTPFVLPLYFLLRSCSSLALPVLLSYSPVLPCTPPYFKIFWSRWSLAFSPLPHLHPGKPKIPPKTATKTFKDE